MGARMPLKVWAALGVVYVVWGSTYLAIRYGVQTVPPLLLAGSRFTLAGVLMLGITIALRGGRALRVSPVEFGNAALVGLLLAFGGNGLVVLAETRVPSGLAALIVAGVPLWIVVLRSGLSDRPGPVTVAGVLVGLAGMAVLFLPGGGSVGAADLPYALVVVLASVCWSVGSVLATRRPVPRDPLVMTTVEMLAGGLVMLAVSAGKGEWSGFAVGQVSGQSWLGLGYLVVFGSLLAFTAYVYLLGVAPVSLVSTYAYVNPVIAVLLGVLVAGERLAGAELVGAAVIVCAVAVVVTEEGRARRRAAPPPGVPEPIPEPEQARS